MFHYSIDKLFETQDDRYIASPKSLMVDAVSRNDEIGSCTVCIVTLDEKAKVIMTANLGDSGYMLLRQDESK